MKIFFFTTTTKVGILFVREILISVFIKKIKEEILF